MNGIPWPEEVWRPIGKWLNVNLYAAFNSEIMLHWVLPLAVWAMLIFALAFAGFMFWAAWRSNPIRNYDELAKTQEQLQRYYAKQVAEVPE